MNEMNMWGQPSNMNTNRMRSTGMQGTQSFGQTTPIVPSYLPGRVINHPNEVRPNEVSMDGAPSVFLLNDASGVVVKWWNGDGQLCTKMYVPQAAPTDGETQSGMPTADFQNAIFERLDKIEKQLKQRPYQKPNNYKKKEVKENA